MMQKHRKVALIVALLGLLPLLFFIDLYLGAVHIPPKDLLHLLLGGLPQEAVWESILFKIRLPKALGAILVGAALAVAGLQMQTLFANPLASPSILGISAGASLGVAALVLASGGFVGATLWGLQGLWLMAAAASAGALVVMLLVLALAGLVRDSVTLLIVGLMIGTLTGALVGLWQYFSAPEQIKDYLLWTFGDLGGLDFAQLQVLACLVMFALALSAGIAKSLNILLLGERYACSLGVNLRRVRWVVILNSSLLAGGVTAFCGPIGFVGIAVPHLCRALFRSADHRLLIPLCALLGALLMLFCDIATRLFHSTYILPINAVTALIGAPVVIWLLIRRAA